MASGALPGSNNSIIGFKFFVYGIENNAASYLAQLVVNLSTKEVTVIFKTENILKGNSFLEIMRLSFSIF
jgi:hypothetical protein